MMSHVEDVEDHRTFFTRRQHMRAIRMGLSGILIVGLCGIVGLGQVGKKLESQRVLEGGVFNLNLRRETAAEEGAGTHGKKSDLYLIRSGEATLTTDGELITPKPAGGAEGDVDGSGIRNGKSRTVKAGDVIFIPAGVPHQITAVNGEVQFLLFRWDTR
jgi:mannose-6-phosphate isomerase-like protein (cupin superfamily)